MSRWDAMKTVFARYPLISDVDDTSGKLPEYGTAGFRGSPDVLLPIACRMAALLAIRCIIARRLHFIRMHAELACGMCITASHNLSKDNGVKLIDIDGEILPPEWEILASSMVGTEIDRSIEILQIKLNEYDICADELSSTVVVLGRDTRPSGKNICCACREVLEAIGARYIDLGYVTTPEMHFCISRAFRMQRSNPAAKHRFENENSGLYSEIYVDHLAQNFKRCCAAMDLKSCQSFRIVVDCANGVTALKLAELQKHLAHDLDINLVNTNTEDHRLLNLESGSDWVIQNKMWSSEVYKWIQSTIPEMDTTLFVSMDGDGDRIVCGVFEDNALHTLCGDYIQSLFLRFLHDFLRVHKLPYSPLVIQTPYANGNSTKYFANTLHVPVQVVPTGVKHCQRAAKSVDLAVYFESNGHGSVQWSKKVLEELQNSGCGDIVRSLAEISSQTCGDAIGNMLFIVLALSFCGLRLVDWKNLYQELPTTCVKVAHKKQIIYRMNSLQTKIESPTDLQEQIDMLVAHVVQSSGFVNNSLRYFVRPSGTEPDVRVFVESNSHALNTKVAKEIECFLWKCMNKLVNNSLVSRECM